MADYGIASIALTNTTSVNSVVSAGVTLFETTLVTLTDGSTLDAGAVGFQFNDHITRYLGDTVVDPELADLPYLNGYGTTRDLDIAMTEDAGLRTMVENLAAMTTADIAGFANAIEDIIIRWTREEDAAVDGRGNYVNGQHLAAMEHLFGDEFAVDDFAGSNSDPRSQGGAILENAWHSYQANVAARLLAQTDLGAEIFPELGYYSAAFLELEPGTSVTTVMQRMSAFAPSDAFEATAFWVGMSLVIKAVRDQFVEQGTSFTASANAALAAAGMDFTFDQVAIAQIADSDSGASQILVGAAGTDDLFISGAGDDTIMDAGGLNTLIYGAGRGNDVIDSGFWVHYTVELVELNADDISVTLADSTGSSIIITILSSGETLTIANVDSNATIGNGNIGGNITLSFADGSTGSISEMLSFETEGSTDGDDTIEGSIIDDILDGGAGNDTLMGGNGSDTYLFGLGGGNDTVADGGAQFNDDEDIIRIDADYADVVTDYNNGDFQITLSDGSVLTVIGGATEIEQFVFNDVSFTGDEFHTILFDAFRTITGTDGDDTLAGNGDDNIINGGLGNDTIALSSGDDTYIYNAGDGIDTFTGFDGGNDSIEVFGYTASDAIITLQPGTSSNIIVTFSATDELRIANFLRDDSFGTESINFDDGTSINFTDALNIIVESQITDGDDVINIPFEFEGIVAGGLGNDVVIGPVRTYQFNAGDGQDDITLNTTGGRILVTGYEASDITVSRVTTSLNDFILTFAGSTDSIILRGFFFGSIELDDGTELTRADLEQFVTDAFGNDANGTIFQGYDSDNSYELGLGDDTINDGAGNDTYIYRQGDGNDIIHDTGSRSQTDTVIFADYNLSDLTITRSGGDVTITFADNPDDSLTIIRQLSAVSPTFFNYSAVHTVENFVFADGTTLDWAELSDLAFQSVSTGGDDIINGTGTHQTLFLSAGNDFLSGGQGNDTYYRPVDASGDDIIRDNGVISTDRLVLEGVNPDDIEVTALGTSVIITFVGASSGTVTIEGQLTSFAGGFHRIESFEFGDGTVWTPADIVAAITSVSDITDALNGTAADETLTGTTGNDLIDGLGGDDILIGGSGSDVYIFGAGSGNDIIDDSGRDDFRDADHILLQNLNSDDVIISRVNTTIAAGDLTIEIIATGEILTVRDHFFGTEEGIEFIHFADGTIWNRAQIKQNAAIRGTDGDDVLTGGNTADPLFGGAGDGDLFGNDGDDVLVLSRAA